MIIKDTGYADIKPISQRVRSVFFLPRYKLLDIEPSKEPLIHAYNENEYHRIPNSKITFSPTLIHLIANHDMGSPFKSRGQIFPLVGKIYFGPQASATSDAITYICWLPENYKDKSKIKENVQYFFNCMKKYQAFYEFEEFGVSSTNPEENCFEPGQTITARDLIRDVFFDPLAFFEDTLGHSYEKLAEKFFSRE
jgi:hypothetical protein